MIKTWLIIGCQKEKEGEGEKMNMNVRKGKTLVEPFRKKKKNRGGGIT